ncbi:MAG: response regulator transcription factor [Firmicutes bacterium]|nr:response regulator transcription factor [Bacillota bacterium]
MDALRVLIVEDEPLYLDLLAMALRQIEPLVIVGRFTEGESALSETASLTPDVALLDIELPGAFNGVQVGLKLREIFPQMGILLLTQHASPGLLATLGDAAYGWGYLLKQTVSDVATLAHALESTAHGLMVIDPRLTRSVHPSVQQQYQLTPRQWEILQAMAEGYNNAAIAQRLYLTEKSVENQINAIYQALGVHIDRKQHHPRVQAVLAYLNAVGA